jgi:heavy metal translocating P-type ATPase
LNVYLILWESGAIQPGQDIRQTNLFERSLKLGLISNQENTDEPDNSARTENENTQEMLLHVTGMWCASCAWLIERAVTRLGGVVRAEASFASDVVKVQYRPQAVSRQGICECIDSLGYKAQDAAESANSNREGRDLVIRTGLAAFLWANVMSLSLVLYAGYFEQISGSIRRGLPLVLMVLATPVVFYCGYPILNLAWRGLLNHNIRMEVLLSLGILAAYGYSVVQAFRGDIHLYFDTATVIVTLVLAGKLIERGAKEKASGWIAALHRMMPNKVRLLAQGSERFVSIDALEPEEIFVVKAGERIPADGVVMEGESHSDESLLTGESAPISKRAGDSVAAGSINLDNVLTVRATKSAQESTLSQIIALVESALGSRCELERTVDRVSRVFVPSVVFLALFTFVFTWFGGAANLVQSLMRSITVLVIACPCALGLATPLAITAAFGSASRRGMLVRDSRVIETLPKIDTLILDKTGTVTEGTFALLDLIPFKVSYEQHAFAGAGITPCFDGDAELGPSESASVPQGELLSLFGSLEQYSEHPLGVAVLNAAREEAVVVQPGRSIEIHKGSGITGVVGTRSIFAGNRRLAKDLGIVIEDEVEQQARTWESGGKTVCFLGWDGVLQALAVFGDKMRSDAAELISQLKKRGVDVRLVSGDSPVTTKWTSSILGIDNFDSEASPAHKAELVRDLQERGLVVAMAGDGINDAPALAQADLGVAMGSGADIAMKAAAVVLMHGSLQKIVEIFELSQRTMRIVRQNLFWAFFYNAIGISLAICGVLNPILAACAMLLSSVSVVANSMRLTRAPKAFL